MDFDLTQAINALDREDVFAIANEARPQSEYLFNSILPNRNMETYSFEGGSMTIRTTMAGQVGMDSRYPEGGAAETSEFSARTGKIAIRSSLKEQFLRELQQKLMRYEAQRRDNTGLIQQTGLNWYNKIIVQAILDREEWLKGQALFTGKLDWTQNGKRLQADYGVPDANFLPARTGANHYGGATSFFWKDIWALQELLYWDVRAYICHPKLMEVILANAEINKIELVGQNVQTGQFTFKRFIERFGNTEISRNPRDTVTITVYNKEAEIWDLDNPGSTKKVPFCPIGSILAIGAPISDNVFIVDEGSTEEPPGPVELGYTHIAPTVEGGGRPGRWGRLFVPEGRVFNLDSEGAENMIPVIQAPERIAVSTSDLA